MKPKHVICACALAGLGALEPAKPHSLFNGRDLSGWHVDVPAMDSTPSARNPFLVRNGLLVSLGEPNGHLISDSVYRDYRLAQGMWWPFSEDRYLEGQRLMHLGYTRVAFNTGVDPSLFEKPEQPLGAPSR